MGDVISLSSGVVFGVATTLACALIRKFKYVGVVIGALVNIVGIALLGFALLRLPHSYPSYQPDWLGQVAVLSGLGIAVGALAGFAAAVVERGARGKIPSGGRPMAVLNSRMRVIGFVPISVVPPVSLSGPGAINPEPSIPIGELHDEGELS